MASKPKSRTGNSNLTKKANVPVWAIALGMVVLVGLGAFFVFKSFAGTNQEATNQTATLYCYNGYCYDKKWEGALPETKIVRYDNNCPASSLGKRWKYLINGNKGIWQCIR